MGDQLQLEVVTPERRVLDESVNSVTVPGRGGEIGILPGHAALISELQTGVLTYTEDGSAFQLHVSGGFVEVNNDRVAVLAEVAERPEEIDAARARLARERAEKTLGSGAAQEDFEKARAKLERSMVRLQLASGAR
jgi:F-type H+-transporting ATPase subunit epsilon